MICTNCGNKLEDDSLFCTKCGCKLLENPSQNYCTYCGNKIEVGAQFCIKCGKPIQGSSNIINKQKKTIHKQVNNGELYSKSRNDYFTENEPSIFI